MAEQVETVIVGAGQSGLALSYCLTRLGREHLVLDRGRIAERWRSERWDSFTLLSPNWHTRLPGYCYQGPDPDGFMTHDELVRYLESFAATFNPPIRTGATATQVKPLATGRWLVEVNGDEPIAAGPTPLAARWLGEVSGEGISADGPARLAARSLGEVSGAKMSADGPARLALSPSQGERARVRGAVPASSVGRAKSSSASPFAIEAVNVVIAIGGFQRPYTPPLAEAMPPDLFQIHTVQYRNPSQLPPGGVLLVGSGTSGQQIAEELYQAGRQVYLSVGRHAKLPRRYRGRDAVWWLDATGTFDETVDTALAESHRPGAALSGVGGGHDLDLRRFSRDGVVLLGHLLGIEGTRLSLADDVEESLAVGEGVEAAFKQKVEEHVARTGLEVPAEEPANVIQRDGREIGSPSALDLRAERITSVIWCTGFRNDLGWVQAPVLDARGEPMHKRGVTLCPGLYFLGLRWLYKRKSSFIDGAAEDAAYVAEHIAARGSPGRSTHVDGD